MMLYVRLRMMLLSLTMVVLSCPEARCGDAEQAEMRLYFNIGRCDIDSCLGQNARTLGEIKRFMAAAACDGDIAITGISIYGYASPEGPRQLNKRLAEGRMRAMEQFAIGGDNTHSINQLHLNNDISGLSALTDEISRSDINGRQTALDILNDSAKQRDTPRIITRLKTTQNGRLWKEIRPLLNKLRYARVVFTFERKAPVALTTPDSIETVAEEVTEEPAVEQPEIPEAVADTIAPEASVQAVETLTDGSPRRPLYIAIKTNMLYDAALIPSIGAEVYLGKMMSISANWSYAWWKSDRRHNYWRYYGGDIAVRRWFGQKAAEKPLTGHHLGLYAQILTYDFELGGKGQMGAKYNYGGGIEYGFSLPVARRINVDFTVGVGYLGGKYHEYRPIDGHYVWQATKQRHWFGPTKAEISLVWLIGHGNTNKSKGGKR